jgi:hypothetical protein
MLGDGFKGYNNMEPSELIEEYKQIEDKWYELYESGSLHFSPSRMIRSQPGTGGDMMTVGYGFGMLAMGLLAILIGARSYSR